MRQAGLAGRAPKRWKKTTIPDPAAAARADAIRRDFTADASKINQRWCGDITYLATWEGKAGSTWPPSSTSPRAASSGSRWLITCAPSWSRTPWPTRSPPATQQPG
jgi:transposase InsO family protein